MNSDTPGSSVDSALTQYIEAFRPRIPEPYWAPIAGFVRAVVHDAWPGSFPTTRQCLVSVAQYVRWCHQTNGLPLDRATIFNASAIASYFSHAASHLSATERKRRHNTLSRVAATLLSGTAHRTVDHHVSEPTPNSPYTPRELISLHTWAIGQPSARQRHNARTMLALAAGCGLTKQEIAFVQTNDVELDDFGVAIHVSGAAPRTVPVLADWEDVIREIVAESGKYLFTSSRGGSGAHQVDSFLVHSHVSELKPVIGRLRATWITTHLHSGTPINVLLQAAGLTSLLSLDRYRTFIPAVASADYRHHLRNAATV